MDYWKLTVEKMNEISGLYFLNLHVMLYTIIILALLVYFRFMKYILYFIICFDTIVMLFARILFIGLYCMANEEYLISGQLTDIYLYILIVEFLLTCFISVISGFDMKLNFIGIDFGKVATIFSYSLLSIVSLLFDLFFILNEPLHFFSLIYYFYVKLIFGQIFLMCIK